MKKIGNQKSAKQIIEAHVKTLIVFITYFVIILIFVSMAFIVSMTIMVYITNKHMYDASIQKAIGSRRFGTVSLCIENESLYP